MNNESSTLRSLLNSIMATCAFQLRNSKSPQRMAVTVILAVFPPVMLSMVAMQNVGSFLPVEFLMILLVSLVCLLSLLLWATPNVYSELEGKSWIFLASRPRGRISCFLGKFLAAFISAFAISFVAISGCVLVAEQFVGLENAMHTWLAMVGIYFLASLVYSAIMSMIGTIAIKRAMVMAAGYIIGWEIILGFFPSVISRLTARYHLQSIGITWLGWFLPDGEMTQSAYNTMYGEPYFIVNLLALIAITCLCLTVGCYVITARQYITADET